VHDRVPYRCILTLLGKIELQEKTPLMARMLKCVKLGRELPGLDEPPFDTPLGLRIYENVSAEAWRMWGEHSKMLLNEYRLQPWKPEAQQFLVEQMEAFFFGPGSNLPKEYVPPKA
jgi:Fe-S cluster biosynthesis and repair protein YggX